MGSYDGAETCELVGLYMLSQLEQLGINIGLYRDDRLAICYKTPFETEKNQERNLQNLQRKQPQYHNRSQPKNCRLPRHHNELKDWRT